MDITEFIEVLGQPIDSPEVVGLFNTNGIDCGSVSVDEHESYTHYCAKDLGYELVLSSEARVMGMTDKPSNYGKLYFTGITLFGTPTNGYTPYIGALPHGIAFGMSRDKVHTILGKPTWVSFKNNNGLSPFERWDNLADFTMHMTYHKDSDLLTTVTIGKPKSG